MRIPTLIFFAFIALSHTTAAEWHFGRMSIRWLDGYKWSDRDDAERFVGPDNEVVMVTSMGLRESGDSDKMAKSYLAFGETELPRLSAAKGKDIMKLRRETLPGGITLFSTAASVTDTDGKMFYLQFLAVTKTGQCALFTVVGNGPPADALTRFRPLFETISWKTDDKQANHEPEPRPGGVH